MKKIWGKYTEGDRTPMYPPLCRYALVWPRLDAWFSPPLFFTTFSTSWKSRDIGIQMASLESRAETPEHTSTDVWLHEMLTVQFREYKQASNFRASSELKHQFASMEWVRAANSWIFWESSLLKHQYFHANTSGHGHHSKQFLSIKYPEMIFFTSKRIIYWASKSSIKRTWAANVWFFWTSSKPNSKIFERTHAGIEPTDVRVFTITKTVS